MRFKQTPISFPKGTRADTGSIMTSGRAGRVVPLAFVPLHRGDSASGSARVVVDLADMPRPVLNAVVVKLQAWFVPKVALPQFTGMDDFLSSYHGESMPLYPTGTRNPSPYFGHVDASETSQLAIIAASDLIKSAGLHLVPGKPVNFDYIDSFNTVHNFRLSAHSSKIPKRKYAAEDLAEATSLPRGFWPTNRLSRVVPDYDEALVVGDLSLDVLAGRIPVSGITQQTNATGLTGTNLNFAADQISIRNVDANNSVRFKRQSGNPVGNALDIFAEMEGQKINVTLANLDRARRTQAFARMAASYAGGDWSEQRIHDTLMAELMQGFSVDEDQLRRPYLLDSKAVNTTMLEQAATDGASLGDSVTQGAATASLSINVPETKTGGVIVFLMELGPNRFFERMSDEYLHLTDPEQLPNALRDTQRVNPVDEVPNHRVDAKHTQPDAIYGYEPMNDVWNRDHTRLGGQFYEATPGAPWSETRSQIWLPDYVDPVYTSDHVLYPEDLPHEVFGDWEGPAFETIFQHSLAIYGLTQIGEPVFEDNGEYELVQGEEA